jgi:hypothetical protein
MAYRDSNPTFETISLSGTTAYYILLFSIFFLTTHSFIHPFAEGPLLFPHCSPLSRGQRPSLGCRAAIRTRACRTANRRTTNFATPQPIWATPHPLSYAARFLLFSHQYFFLVEGHCTLCTIVVVGKGSKKQPMFCNVRLDLSTLIVSMYGIYMYLYTYYTVS